MGLEVVVNEILARGSSEEQDILQKAETERRALLDRAEGEADEIRAKALAETRAKLEAVRREQHSAAEFEVRRRLLTAQNELAGDFRRRVLEALRTLPEKEHEKVLAALVKQAQKDLPKGRVHARKDDLAALATGGYEKGEAIDAVGGFQVESPDGSVLLDYRFDTLLEGVWKEILAESRKLFEGS